MQKKRLEMSVPVIFAGLVMLVVWPCRRQLFQPFPDVLNQSALMIIHINSSSDMHGRNKAQSVLYAAALDDLFHRSVMCTISRRFLVSNVRYSVWLFIIRLLVLAARIGGDCAQPFILKNVVARYEFKRGRSSLAARARPTRCRLRCRGRSELSRGHCRLTPTILRLITDSSAPCAMLAGLNNRLPRLLLLPR